MAWQKLYQLSPIYSNICKWCLEWTHKSSFLIVVFAYTFHFLVSLQQSFSQILVHFSTNKNRDIIWSTHWLVECHARTLLYYKWTSCKKKTNKYEDTSQITLFLDCNLKFSFLCINLYVFVLSSNTWASSLCNLL